MYKNAEKFRLFRPNFKFLISLERYSNTAPLPVKRPGRPEAPLKVMDQLNLLVLRRLKGEILHCAAVVFIDTKIPPIPRRFSNSISRQDSGTARSGSTTPFSQ